MNKWLEWLLPFIKGMGSIMDIGGTSSIPKPMSDAEAWKADSDAIRSDWEQVIGPWDDN